MNTPPNLHDFIRFRLGHLARLRYAAPRPLTGWQIIDHLPLDSAFPADDDLRWRSIHVGERWGAAGTGAAFRTLLPPLPSGSLPILHIALFDYDQPPADAFGLNVLQRPEGTLYAEGIPPQTLDRGHREVWLQGVHSGPIRVWAAAGFTPEPRLFHRADLAFLDPALDSLYYDAATLYELAMGGQLPAEHTERILDTLYRGLSHLDFRHVPHVRGVEEAAALIHEEAFIKPDPAGPHIHALGHAHIDLGWLWPLRYSIGKGLRTAGTQLNLMSRYPHYTYLMSQPQLYEAIRRHNPALFAEIKARIAEGRWNATGATWVEMDTNLPNGESLVRQLLHGMRYFQRELGVRPKVLWLPDCFGYSPALPQLMKLADVPYFYTSKMSWNDINRFPFDTFRWRGLDGSEVLVHLATTRRKGSHWTIYEGEFTPDEAASTWHTYRQKTANKHVVIAYGFGDGGGGPNREMMERLSRYHEGISGMPSVQATSAEKFFEALRADYRGELPIWIGEMYLEYHRGCYTTQARTKRYNRKLESALHEAEFLRAWAALEGLLAYPRAELRAAWDVLLTNQFHDILPGSSIRETYEQAEAEYAAALESVEGLIAAGTHALGNAIGPAREAGIVVFNTLSHRPFTPIIEIDQPIPDGMIPYADGEDATAIPLPYQALSNGHTLIQMNGFLPRLGAKRCRFQPGTPVQVTTRLTVSTSHLENDRLRVEFDGKGRLSRVYDYFTNRELLPPGRLANQLQLFHDMPAKWDAWELDADFERHHLATLEANSVRVVESGPVRVALEFTYTFGQSTILQVVRLEAGSNPTVTFDTVVDWHERHTLLKAAFPVDLNAARALYETQFGLHERPVHRNTTWQTAQFEVPFQRWFALREQDFGIALINDCKYGGDVYPDQLRLTLLRAPTAPDPEADQGVQRFTYGLLPFTEMIEVVHRAAALNTPCRAVTISPAAGEVTAAQWLDYAMWEGHPTSGGNVNVILDTVKLAEDDDGLIVRAYEPVGARAVLNLTFARSVRRVQEVNLLEEPIGEIPCEGNVLKAAFRPFQVRTFKVTF